MRWCAIGLVLAVSGATAAQASFELMLMAGSEGIHRYDATNNIYLGKIGQLDGPFYDVVHDTSHPGEVLALNAYGAVSRYNIYTGQFLGGFSLPTIDYAFRPKISVMNDGRLLVTQNDPSISTGRVRIYSNSGTLLSTLFSGGPGFGPTDAQQTPDGNIHVMFKYNVGSTFAYYKYQYNSSGTFTNGGSYDTSSFDNAYSEMSLMGNNLVLSAGYGAVNPSYTKVFASPYTGSGTPMNMTSYYSVAGMTNWTFGHNNNGYMIHGVNTGSYVNKLYVYNPISNVAKVTGANVGTTDNINAISMINAPEPGAWIGLGVGCLGILMRRKRRART